MTTLGVLRLAIVAHAAAGGSLLAQALTTDKGAPIVKYMIQCVPNPDMLVIQLTRRVSTNPMPSRGLLMDQRPPSLMRQLVALDGVVEVTFDGYSIWIEKGSAFDWHQVLPKALKAIKGVLVPHSGRLLKLPSAPYFPLESPQESPERCQTSSCLL